MCTFSFFLFSYVCCISERECVMFVYDGFEWTGLLKRQSKCDEIMKHYNNVTVGRTDCLKQNNIVVLHRVGRDYEY